MTWNSNFEIQEDILMENLKAMVVMVNAQSCHLVSTGVGTSCLLVNILHFEWSTAGQARDPGSSEGSWDCTVAALLQANRSTAKDPDLKSRHLKGPDERYDDVVSQGHYIISKRTDFALTAIENALDRVSQESLFMFNIQVEIETVRNRQIHPLVESY